MANLTQPTDGDVSAFLDQVANPQRRDDAIAIADLIRQVTGTEPTMWGPSMVGYGRQHLRYESGRELDWFVLGFSPRSTALTLYGIEPAEAHAQSLGAFTSGKGCIYIKRLDAVDLAVLRGLIADAWSAAQR